MDKLIMVKSITLLFFYFSFLNIDDHNKKGDASAFQVVKVCYAHDVDYGQPLNCGPGTTNITPDQNGIAIALLDIHVANLIPNGLGQFRLPDQAPPMYVEYDNANGQINVTGPVTVFEFQDIINGVPVYQAIVPLTFNFTEPCDSGFSSVPDTSNARVVRSNIQNVNNPFYPIHDYSSPGEMFTCEIFSETCWDCPGNICLGTNTDPQADFYFCVDCTGGNATGGGGGGTGGGLDPLVGGNTTPQIEMELNGETSETTPDVADQIQDIHISPNPFNTTFNVQLAMKTLGTVTIQIYDQKGQLIAIKQPNLPKGDHIIEFAASHWQTGIYYCQVVSERKVQTMKLVKL